MTETKNENIGHLLGEYMIAERGLIQEAINLISNPELKIQATFLYKFNEIITDDLATRIKTRLNEVVNEEFGEEINRANSAASRALKNIAIDLSLEMNVTDGVSSMIKTRNLYDPLLKKAKEYARVNQNLAPEIIALILPLIDEARENKNNTDSLIAAAIRPFHIVKPIPEETDDEPKED